MCSSVKLVEQELWQREEKGLIGILPVRDSAETATSGTATSSGDLAYPECYCLCPKLGRKRKEEKASCSKNSYNETYI